MNGLQNAAGQRFVDRQNLGNGCLGCELDLEFVFGSELVCGMPVDAVEFQVGTQRRLGTGGEG